MLMEPRCMVVAVENFYLGERKLHLITKGIDGDSFYLCYLDEKIVVIRFVFRRLQASSLPVFHSYNT